MFVFFLVFSCYSVSFGRDANRTHQKRKQCTTRCANWTSILLWQTMVLHCGLSKYTNKHPITLLERNSPHSCRCIVSFFAIFSVVVWQLRARRHWRTGRTCVCECVCVTSDVPAIRIVIVRRTFASDCSACRKYTNFLVKSFLLCVPVHPQYNKTFDASFNCVTCQLSMTVDHRIATDFNWNEIDSSAQIIHQNRRFGTKTFD